jgi:tetratricopeptide (TPR) repeat protein
MYWGNLAHARRWDPNLAPRAPEAFQKAIDLAQREIVTNPRDAELHARLAEYFAALGERTESFRTIARAEALEKASGYVQARAAVVYEQAGERNRALHAVQSALELGYSLEEIQNDPVLSHLREDSRYGRLLNRPKPAAQNTCSLNH